MAEPALSSVAMPSSAAPCPAAFSSWAGTRVLIEPRLTYRSQLGAVDPSLTASDQLNSRTAIRASVGRATFSNDSWIWPDVLNSLGTLLVGHDTRNHFRATRAEAAVSRQWESAISTLAPYVG